MLTDGGSHACTADLPIAADAARRGGEIGQRLTRCPASGALMLRVEAADEDHLRRLEDLIASRLERSGRRDRLTVTWQRPGEAG